MEHRKRPPDLFIFAWVTHLAEATIIAKLEAGFRLVEAYVTVNAKAAIAELDELAAAISTEFTEFKTR